MLKIYSPYRFFLVTAVLVGLLANSCTNRPYSEPGAGAFPPSTAGQAAEVPTLAALHARTPKPAFQKGFSIATWDRDTYARSQTVRSLANLRATGTEWLAVVVTWYQDDVDSLNIAPTTLTPTDESLRTLIGAAHKLGFKVMLKPHVDLSGGGDGWRAQIGGNFTPGQWSEWFASYTAMITHFARLAKENSVEQFCIGTELGTAARQAEHWRAVTFAVRKVYSGRLVYASNSPTMDEITWWDALDFIGVNAYLDGGFTREVSLADLESVWRAFLPRLEDLSVRFNHMPVLITETGSASYDGAANHPPHFEHDQPLDLQEQADSYQAFFNTAVNQSWLAGVYWYGWEPNPYRGGACDYDFTPFGKPAESVLRTGYGADPQLPGPSALQPPEEAAGTAVFEDQFSAGWNPDWSWDVDWSLVPDPGGAAGRVAAVRSDQGYLSLHHTPFPTVPYRWISVRIRFSRSGQRLFLSLSDENDRMLGGYLLSDCLSIDGADFPPETWHTYNVPVEALLAEGRPIQRINIGGGGPAGEGMFWVDDLRWIP